MKKITDIRICSNHQEEYATPLIYTFAFCGSEYWCPYCGINLGMFEADKLIKSTPILINRYRKLKKLSKPYLLSIGNKNNITPPWKYGQKIEKNV